MRFLTINDRQLWWAVALLFCLAAIAGSFARADPGAVTKYVLPDGRVVYSDQPVPGGKPVKEIEQVPDPTASSASRLTPFEQNATLAEVAGTDRVDLVKDRLARGADPNAPGKSPPLTPLQAAAAGGRAETVDLLLRAGADPNLVPPMSQGGPPLCAAASGASRGHAEVTRLLLKRGARANDKCMAGYGPTPLMIAAERGSPDSVRALLASGADVDVVDWSPNSFPKRDTTALMYAAKEGQYEAVKLLLDAGAKVDAKMLPGGWTALWLAADGRFATDGPSQRDYAGIARELLKHGADVSAAPTSDPRTPLFVAATKNTADFVKVLLEFGASPNDRDREGQTPLMHAAKRGDVNMTAALLAKGADPLATDNSGRTALQLATMLGFTDVARLLSAEPTSKVQPAATQAAPKRDEAKLRTLSATWQFEVPLGVSSGPFLVGNMVLAADWNGLVYALDAASGRAIWTFKTKGVITSDPSVLDDVLYFGGAEGQSQGGRGTVYAVSLRSGKGLWSRDFNAVTRYLMVSGSMLIIENGDGAFISLDARSGKTVWQESGLTGSLQPVVSGGAIAAVTRDGNLHGFDAQTGREKWKLSTSRPNPKASQFREHLLKILPEGKERNSVMPMGSDGLYIYGAGVCQSLAEGRTPRQVQENLAEFFGPELANALTQVAHAEICPPGTTPDQIAAAAKSAQEAPRVRGGATTAPVGDGAGNVYVVMGTSVADRLVLGVDAQSGARVFAASLEGHGVSPPVLGAGFIFVHEGNNLLAFDLASKTRVWSLDLQSQAQPDPTTVFYEGGLLIAGKTLLAVDAKTGVVSWRAGPQLRQATLLGVANGVAYCRTFENYYGVDARTGAVLWATPQRNDLLGVARSVTAYSKDMFFHSHGNYVFGVYTADRGEASH